MSSKQVYLLGCGGMGMAPLALYLKDQSYTVLGWDDYVTEERKKQLSYIIWQPTPPPTCDLCIYSSAISSQKHSIFKQAQQQGSCIRRGAFVAQLLKNKRLCVVCGSHGKSTTTAYLVHFFQQHQIPLNYIIGAEFQQQAYPTGVGRYADAWTLIELDESDGTIDAFSPDIAVILNTDWDHPQHYPDATAYKNAFEALAQRTKQAVITHQTFATAQPQHILPIATDYIQNDLSIAAYTFHYMTGQRVTEQNKKSFPGLKRRKEILLQTQQLTVVSDYAHHPSEVQSFLHSLNAYPGEKVIAFEPHRCSRLYCFFKDFVKVLQPIDHLYLRSTYQAFEENIGDTPDLFQALLQAQSLEQLTPESFLLQNKHKTVAFIGAGYIDRDAYQWVERWTQAMQQLFRSKNISVKTNADLRHASTFNIGGTALFLCEPSSLDELQALIALYKTLGLPVTPLGLGSNVLIPDQRYDGVVVRLNHPSWKTYQAVETYTYNVGAGLPLKTFLDRMEADGVGGFEFLDGIPGTIGGALSMNAGTGQQGILDRIIDVYFLDHSGLHRISQSDLEYHYRACPTLRNGIILSAHLKGTLSASEVIKKTREQLRIKRHQSQPQGYSLGCFFKNTTSGSTGKILDELGLKNMHVGDVFVSPKHANFILNKGNGSFQDVIRLVRFLCQQVLEKRGIVLEPEVRILGKTWEEFL